MPTLSRLLEVVVVHLDAKDDEAARGGHRVGDEQCPEGLWLVQDALQHEADATDSHHEKGWKRDVVGLACANGLNGLWQIAEYHADAGDPAANFVKDSLFHNVPEMVVGAKVRQKLVIQN